MTIEVNIATGFSQIKAQEWDGLTDGSPLLSHRFFSALEDTLCVGEGTGWQSYPVTVHEQGKLIGAAPLYLKQHSYGEYVFDWAWANAYEQNGLNYYPKLLVAIPFTPISGPRLLSQRQEVQRLLARIVQQQMEQNALSSSHILFPDAASAEALQAEGWMQRDGVQFRWENEGFRDFSEFIAQLSHDKRKKIKQERKKILSAGVVCRRLQGRDIQPADWDFFYECYVNTYHEHRSSPYLTRAFFEQIGHTLPEHLLLIIAELDGKPIASALNLYDDDTLYGRYWGALSYIPGLHFELCYYQAQEFCLENNIRFFEGGAQGEHKLARGFMPRPTCSFHRIANPEFESAIRRFVAMEASNMQQYQDELEERAPYRAN